MGSPAGEKKQKPASRASDGAAPVAPAAEPRPLPGPPGRPSLARTLTPRLLLDSTPAEWLWRIGEEKRHLVLLAALAAAIFLPWTGAVGFWDPWETHYGEVARSMIAREDFVHPYWENAYFFSKPILSLWLIALGLLAGGAETGAPGIGVYAEWGVRSVFALTALGGALVVSLAAARTLGRRAGLWAGVVLVTSPLYFLLARQAMVDMPFVAATSAAIGCLMIAVFSGPRVRDGWLYAFYALAGLAVLAKGFLGIVLPGAAMLGYLLLSGDWHLLLRLRLFTGALVTALVAGPWLGWMIAFDGKDDESKTFFQRFIIHDHFKRAGFDPTRGHFVAGVHTTTPNTTWVYYVEQLGFGLFPWVAALPGALAMLLRPRAPDDAATRRHKARLFVLAWAVTSFALFSFAATKFHHYVFPVVPPLAILVGLFMEDLLEEGLRPHALALLLGGLLFAMIAHNLVLTPKHLADLFVYNYERPYPDREVDPRVVFSVLFSLTGAAALLGIPRLRGWIARQSAEERDSDRLWVAGALAIAAVVFASYVSAYHWRKLSHHWTQRDIFWIYNHEAQPDEQIAAYQMNWRGETFYSRNTVRQIKEASDIKRFAALPGRQWVIVEHGRLSGLKNTLSGHEVRVVDKTANKFSLVTVD